MYLPQCLSDMIKLHWLTSDLIPERSEKFKFRENFVTLFTVSKTDPKIEIYPCNCRKIAKWNSKFKSGIFTWKWKKMEKLIFYRNQYKIQILCVAIKKVFDSWIKSYEAYSIFRSSTILELFGFFKALSLRSAINLPVYFKSNKISSNFISCVCVNAH